MDAAATAAPRTARVGADLRRTGGRAGANLRGARGGASTEGRHVARGVAHHRPDLQLRVSLLRVDGRLPLQRQVLRRIIARRRRRFLPHREARDRAERARGDWLGERRRRRRRALRARHPRRHRRPDRARGLVERWRRGRRLDRRAALAAERDPVLERVEVQLLLVQLVAPIVLRLLLRVLRLIPRVGGRVALVAIRLVALVQLAQIRARGSGSSCRSGRDRSRRRRRPSAAGRRVRRRSRTSSVAGRVSGMGVSSDVKLIVRESGAAHRAVAVPTRAERVERIAARGCRPNGSRGHRCQSSSP
jgi:hypothetical protein